MKNKYIIIVSVLIIALGLTYFVGWMQGKEKLAENIPTISSQIIIDKIQEQYFLVTKSLFLNTSVDLNINDVQGWKKFFVADSINAQGIIRVDVGVDLIGIKERDVIIDTDKKSITLYIPPAEILDSSLTGDMQIETNKGIWTSIQDFIDGDEGEEYNLAVRELIVQAESATKSKPEIFQEARADSVSLVELIIKNLASDYALELRETE